MSTTYSGSRAKTLTAEMRSRSSPRVILQDFTDVPTVVNFAERRDAVLKINGNPKICSSDLVIDYSIQVDLSGDGNALNENQDLELERNKE
jgi:aconitate hydratase